jgi:hypothetical protein
LVEIRFSERPRALPENAAVVEENLANRAVRERDDQKMPLGPV